MEKFQYKVKDKEGKTVSGTVEARDKSQAAKILQEKGLLVIDLEVKRESLFQPAGGSFLSRVTMTDKVNFTRQLATMINSGLSVTNALSILEAQSNPAMAKVVGDILRDVEGGNSLSRALKKHPRVFDQIYVALVQAGEAAGILDGVLVRLADNLEAEREFNSRVKGALIYPIIVVVGMVAVAGIMIIFVIPKLTALYEEFQADLPLSTKVLLFISKVAVRFWPIVLMGLVGLFFGLRIALKSPLIKRQYERVLFRLPIVGKLKQQIMFTEFTRTLGLLIGAGVLVVDALSIVKQSLGSEMYEEVVTKASDEVEKGFPLATALARTEMFPPIIPQMVGVGEETGKLNEVLGKVSAYFEQESAQSVRNLTTAMEPLIMIVLGVGVGFLMIAVIMPIYNLTSQF